MNKELIKHITKDTPDIDWRLEDKLELLEKFKVIGKEAETAIWNRLKGDEFLLEHYALNSAKFDIFESIEFRDNYDLVTARLKKMATTNDNVVLTWFAAGQTLLTDFKTFMDNWDDFCYPSSDDLVVIHESWDWIIYISHFESFQIGQGIKDK